MAEISKSVSKYRERECPECGEFIPASALVCPKCDARLLDEDDDDYGRPSRRRRGNRDCEPHRATLILVLGIMSVVVGLVGIVTGPLAWIFAHSDLKKMRAGTMDPEGESMTRIGMIFGIIGTAIQSVLLLLTVLWVVIFGGAMCCCGMAGTAGKVPGATRTQGQPAPGRPGR